MTNQPPTVLRIGYRMERADYIALCRAMETRSPLRLAVEIGVFYAAVALAILVGAGFDPSRFGEGVMEVITFGAPWWIYPMLLLGPLLALLYPQLVALRAALAYRRYAVADRHVEVAVDGNGVTTTVPNLQSHMGWDAVIRVIETPAHAFLAISRREALILPRRAFADDHDYRTLIRFARARLAATLPATKPA